MIPQQMMALKEVFCRRLLLLHWQEFDNSVQRSSNLLHPWTENLFECHHLLWNHCGWFLFGGRPRGPSWKLFVVRNTIWSSSISVCVPFFHLHEEGDACSRRKHLVFNILQQC